MKFGKYGGKWWLPEHADSKIRGVLIVTASDLTLEVENDFSDDQELFPHHVFIHGEFHDEEEHKDKNVTLHSLQMTSKSYSGLHQKFRYNIDYVLEGRLFYNTEQMQFKIISVEMDHLDDWISTPLIEIKDEGIKTIVSYDGEKQWLWDIDGHFKLGILTNTGYDTIARPFKELTIKQKSYITLDFTKNISMKTLIDVVRHLQDFFSFALGNTVRVISVVGVTVPDTIPKKRIPIQLVDLTYLTITSNLSIKQLDESMVYFRYVDVKEQFPKLVKNWFDKKDRLSVVLNLYFKNMYVPASSPIECFMDFARAIEVYHRKSFPNNIDPKDIHKERINEIRCANHQYSAWLKENLAFSNEKKLQTRLDEIIQRYPSVLGNSDPSSITAFTRILKHTRNYHTHYGRRSSQALVEDDKISTFSHGLKLILDVIIMSEIGFPDEQICDLSASLRRSLGRDWMHDIVEHCNE